MPKKYLKIAVLLLLTTTLGCRAIMKQMQPNFLKGPAAQKAAQGIKDKVGQSFKVQEVEITEGSFKMKIETPGNAQNIDEYTSLGYAVSDPQPVQLNGNTRSLDRLPFEEIDFTVVPQIAKNALDKTQIEGGAVVRMTFLTYIGNKFGWDVQVQGTRESASVRADLAGNIVGTDLSQTNRAANYQVLNETELNKAAEVIKAKFGEGANIEELDIRGNAIGLRVLNPENPKVVDSYTFGIDGLKKSTMPSLPLNAIDEAFSLGGIKLTDAIALLKKAQERLGIPGGEMNLITLTNRRGFEATNKTAAITWAVSVRSGANNGTVSYDAALNEISIHKD